MESKILKTLHMETIDPMVFVIVLGVICIGLLTMILITQSKLKKITQKYEKFMQGKDLESMEDLIRNRFEQIDTMMEDTKKNTEDIKALFENMQLAIQKVGIVKYDAFHEMGGKLSFVLAMLDDKNNGFVMNAIHSREGCYTYIKEVIEGHSYIPLGNEETEALNQAMGIVEG